MDHEARPDLRKQMSFYPTFFGQTQIRPDVWSLHRYVLENKRKHQCIRRLASQSGIFTFVDQLFTVLLEFFWKPFDVRVKGLQVAQRLDMVFQAVDHVVDP